MGRPLQSDPTTTLLTPGSNLKAGSSSKMSGDPAALARILMKQKEDVEAEMDAYLSQLKAHNVTPTTPLTDPSGFPRADIDVWTIRQARAAVARLRNDHRAVVERLGKVLEEVYRRPESAGDGVGGDGVGDVEMDGGGSGSGSGAGEEERVLARVNLVSAGSPASAAGLQPHDLIISFGSLSASRGNNHTLTDIGQLVQRSEGVEIPLTIRRKVDSTEETQLLELKLTPRTGWGGRGMLGMHIVPA